MIDLMKLAVLAMAAAILAGCVTATERPAQGSPDAGTWYTRLVGAAADGAQNQLRINGFRQVDSFDSGRDGNGSVWYNDPKRQCLQVITVRGRVDSAVDIQTHPKCTSHGAGQGGPTQAMPSRAEQACLRAVTQTTNNPDVVLLESTYSEAGTEVIVGVGPQRARWRCIGYRDGTTGEVMSLTDEGRL